MAAIIPKKDYRKYCLKRQLLSKPSKIGAGVSAANEIQQDRDQDYRLLSALLHRREHANLSPSIPEYSPLFPLIYFWLC